MSDNETGGKRKTFPGLIWFLLCSRLTHSRLNHTTQPYKTEYNIIFFMFFFNNIQFKGRGDIPHETNDRIVYAAHEIIWIYLLL